MKKFIMCCPFQPEGQLKLVKYETSGNSRLEYGTTRFPLIPMMNAYAEDGEHVKLVLIESDNENVIKNKKLLDAELDALKYARGIEAEIISIKTKYSEDINSQLKLFADIVSSIEDGDDIYICDTYGTKPTPIIQNMAVNYAYRAMSNVNVGCVVYGQFDHVLGKSVIFDITALFYMGEVANSLAKLGIKDPAKRIRDIMDI